MAISQSILRKNRDSKTNNGTATQPIAVEIDWRGTNAVDELFASDGPEMHGSQKEQIRV
jgi:hypothetical protein